MVWSTAYQGPHGTDGKRGFRCPLTALARDLGDATGSVTDIYLPKWFARNLPVIHIPLILAAVALLWRNHRLAHSGTATAERERRPAQASAGETR
ncbi:hypothetical protein ABIB51_002536 [Arthrobacter sp. UYCu712]